MSENNWKPKVDCDTAIFHFIQLHPGCNRKTIINELSSKGYDHNKILRRLAKIDTIVFTTQGYYLRGLFEDGIRTDGKSSSVDNIAETEDNCFDVPAKDITTNPRGEDQKTRNNMVDNEKLSDEISEYGQAKMGEAQGRCPPLSDLFVNLITYAKKDPNLNEIISRIFKNIDFIIGAEGKTEFNGLFKERNMKGNKHGSIDIKQTQQNFAEICEIIGDKKAYNKEISLESEINMRQMVAEHALVAWNICSFNRCCPKNAMEKIVEIYESHSEIGTTLLQTLDLKLERCWDDDGVISYTTVKEVDGKSRIIAVVMDPSSAFEEEYELEITAEEVFEHALPSIHGSFDFYEMSPICDECINFSTNGLKHFCLLHEEEIFDIADSCNLWTSKS